MIKKFWKKQEATELQDILNRKEFLLGSPIFTNQKYISAKVAKRMIEKLFEV
jgi:hypothetical protein